MEIRGELISKENPEKFCTLFPQHVAIFHIIKYLLLKTGKLKAGTACFYFLCRMFKRFQLYFFPALATLLTRLPFLFAGYGSEDDSWGLVQNARLMAETGTYTFSRLPGHPVQEYVLMLMPDAGPLAMNLLSLLFSILAVLAFTDCMRLLRLPNVLLWSLIFSLVPVFFISGTYTIDYNWALAFILWAWNFQLRGKLWLAGVFIGLAAGCRLTSVLVLPAFFWFSYSTKGFRTSVREMAVIAFFSGFTALICFTPALLNYGIRFFDTYRLPYPSIPKVLLKYTYGVWGITGVMALAIVKLNYFRHKKTILNSGAFQAMLILVFTFSLAFFLLPQKSSFMIPAIPFALLVAASVPVTNNTRVLLAALFLVSPVLFGINLSDAERGSSRSAAAIELHVAGQDVFFDVFTGPILIEHSRRMNRITYIRNAHEKYMKLKVPTALLCGWWMNQMLEEVHENGSNPNVYLVEYATENQIDSLLHLNLKINHLDEIDRGNDERYGITKTSEISVLLD